MDLPAADQFPAGLRVLVVDDDMACLKILEQMLVKCLYRVTICCRATKALSLLRERKGAFDMVISDVHMPDMDGFKLLELVGLEMDLPVIMMSADGRTSAVMRGIKHGACDYLIKPVRIEELKNIWQHVVRKRWSGSKEHEQSGSMEDSDHHRKAEDDNEYASSVIEGSDSTWKPQKKKRDSKEEEEGELENEDPSASKKPRVVWSVELHQQFVSAVNQLGIDKAVPKRILELMNVPGLTRENVASHLQKFRLYLKRISGVAQHQSGFPNPFYSPSDSNTKASSLGRLDFQALAASGQIPPQTLAALHAEMLGRPSGCLVLPTTEQPSLVQASKCIPFQSGVAHGEPLWRCQANIKQTVQSTIPLEGVPSGFPNWSTNHHGVAAASNSLSGVNNVQNVNLLAQMLQQQQQQFPAAPESHHPINVQPSCVVIPSQSSSTVQMGQCSTIPDPAALSTHSTASFPVSQNYDSQNNGKAVDCNLLSTQPCNVFLDVEQVSDVDFKNVPLLKGYTIPGSFTTTAAPSSGGVDNSTSHIGPTGRMPSNISYQCTNGIGTNLDTLKSQGQGRNLGFVGKGTCIPRRFAVDDIESPTNEVIIRSDIDKVKQEVHLDFEDAPSIRTAMLQHTSLSDMTSLLSK